MFIILNILIIALVLLIAYWWANQGLFSAILHLVCVIVAGAVALAVWEPLTLGLLIRGNMFDDFAWGAALIGVFAITYGAFRFLTDTLRVSDERVVGLTGAQFLMVLVVGAGGWILLRTRPSAADAVERAEAERID